MRHNFINRHALLAGLSIAALGLSSCLDKGDESIILENAMSQLVADIPSDDMATPNPTVNNPTTTLPNATCSVERNGDGVYVASINMTGVWNEDAEEWLKLYGTAYDAQNVWVSVDGNPKGIDVYNTADGEGARTVSADLVFLVDHSGSMGQEADGLANQVIAWSQKLAQSGLDIRFGCVGYGAGCFSNSCVGGAVNLTTATTLKAFFDRSTSTSRTMGFYGSDAETLKSKATSGNYDNGSWGNNECGMVALRYADDNFAFRSGSNRIYVNFTDEPNQPDGSQAWSVEALKTNIWNTSKGTIHTVWSGGTYSWTTLRYEDPKLMSVYTGGTSKDVSPSFTNVTLDDLPVTGAMQNSYIIRFTNISEFMDGQPHVVKVTVVSSDGKVQAEKEFYVIFGVAE